MKKLLTRSMLALAIAATTTLAVAQERPRRQAPLPKDQRQTEQRQTEQGQAGQRQGDQGRGVLQLLPSDAVTEHSIDLPGGKLAYTATAGTLSLFDQSGERSAAIFYTAYVVKDAGPNRPVTFVFNGGPGAASAYLHLGLAGPRIVQFGANGRDPSAPRLQDNPDTWLVFTDLVFIDPIGTGWSRPAKSDNNAFYGVRADAEAIAKTIALYVAKNSRSASPKYLLGESYGGFRAAKVAQVLQREQGIAVSGIVMLSPLLEGNLTFGGSRLALGAALQLPSLAAAELERNGTFSQAALAEAERFAMTDYLTTLAGPPPQGEAARAFYARVAKISGLPVDVVARSRGFIRDAYLKHFSEGKVVSNYDVTFAVPDPFPEQESARNPDPLLDGLTRAYGGAMAAYARDELGFKTDITYVLLASNIVGKWDWGEGAGRRGAGVSDDLRNLLALIPSFRLLVAHGYSDMVTPYGAARYVLDHIPDIGDAKRKELRLYRGGHMFYLDAGSRRDFNADAKAFYRPAP